MSTHIPADHFTKPILARLGVGKGPGGKGWIELSPKFLWNEPSIVWHDNKHGIDSGSRSRAFCGAIAPTGDRIEMVQGPIPEFPAVMQSFHGVPYGVPLYRALVNFSLPWMEAKFPGEQTIGYVKIEQEQERLDRVRQMMIAANIPQHPWSAWPKWQADNAEKCRRRVVLYLPRRIHPCTCSGGFSDGMIRHAGDCRADFPDEPDFGAIDCPKCLAAWDAFAADTGATVEVIPTPAEQGDDEPWGAGAADRGGRW